MSRLTGYKKKKNVLVSIEIGPSGIALTKIEQEKPGQYRVAICEYFDETDFLRQKVILRDAVMTHNLMGYACNLVLHPCDYQLLLVEAPNVMPDELKQAMKWRIKDLVSEAVDEIIVDVFPLPDDAFRGRTAMAYVVVVTKNMIKQQVSCIRNCGLELLSIDIPELCLRNITALIQQQSKDGVGLLLLGEGNGLINLTEGQSLYLSRKIEMDVSEIADLDQTTDPKVESLALEVQRTLDYYESQLGKGVITRIMVAPTSVNIEAAVKLLNKILHVKVDCIDMNIFLDMGEIPIGTQAKCFAAIGAALRQDAA